MNWDISTAEGMSNAVAWTERHLARIKRGGVWIVPRSLSIYQIEHGTRTVLRRTGGDSAIEKVLHRMGWNVRQSDTAFQSHTVYNPHTQRGII